MGELVQIVRQKGMKKKKKKKTNKKDNNSVQGSNPQHSTYNTVK